MRARRARAWLENTAKRQIIQSHIWGPTPFPEIEQMLSEEPAMLRSYPTLMARRGAIVGRLGPSRTDGR